MLIICHGTHFLITINPHIQKKKNIELDVMQHELMANEDAHHSVSACQK